MRFLQSTCLVSVLAIPLQAEPVTLTGSIGPYDIEVELDRVGDGLDGRYRYAGKNAWLALTGETFAQDAMQLTERVDGQETGHFFLARSDAGLVGFWANKSADYPVSLSTSGDAMSLFAPIETDAVDTGPTGQYHVGVHWVNDWFASNYEIGFNGGTVNVAMIDADHLLVHFDFIVGPTYHIASFRGVAERTAENFFEYKEVLEGGEEACHLSFAFEGKSLSVSDDGTSWACQFGARAHANFDLQKISNTAEFQDQW